MSVLQVKDVLRALWRADEPLMQRIAADARFGPIDETPDGHAASRRGWQDFEIVQRSGIHAVIWADGVEGSTCVAGLERAERCPLSLQRRGLCAANAQMAHAKSCRAAPLPRASDRAIGPVSGAYHEWARWQCVAAGRRDGQWRRACCEPAGSALRGS